jgi:signal transduction histidine kinase
MEQERSRLLQRFIGDISHDLNTPITSIKLSLDILRMAPGPKKQQKQLEILEAQVSHLQGVLADMINMSRLDNDAGSIREQIELNLLVFNLIRDQQFLVVQKNHRLEFSPSAEPLSILADSRQLRHVITAVFTNALKYTPTEGDIFIRTHAENGYAVFEVQDNGIGINPTDLPHIFERFYRADQARGTEKGGAGLGLAISKKIIDTHLGTIDVESQLGEGTTVYVRVPLVSSSQAPKSSS